MKTLLATALLLAASAVQAHDVDLNTAASIVPTEVATVYSEVGEGRTDFIKRVSSTFTGYTAETGHEACGLVAVLKDGADGVRPTFSIKVVTLGSQIACGTRPADLVEGYTSMGDTAHSHPEKRVLRLTARDMALRGNPAGQLRTESVNNCKPSAQDYTQKGFLFACGKVIYQTGRGTDKEL